ncbi:MAG TPA: PhnD/SsuA/transferrin family substrate-binding protein [Steroidobacteraceae bacterium]|nr:PhnD/SsuA/transferrin family substrate-binding protein [Steroidobacteraceae bacterium]
MIANARMYAVSPEAAAIWRTLLETLIERAQVPVAVIEHEPPASIEALWGREDLGAVFMCGLPYARAQPPPHLIAAPVPSPVAFSHAPRYWSEWIVRTSSPARILSDTWGGRLALTVAHSQSGCIAALAHLMSFEAPTPLYRELIGPTQTPLGSLEAVAQGRADVAAIDAYAWALLERFRPQLTREVRIIDRTLPTPIPALVASPSIAVRHLQSLREAFRTAHTFAPLKPALEALSLGRFAEVTASDYTSLQRNAERTLAHWRHHRLAASIDPHFKDLVAV